MSALIAAKIARLVLTVFALAVFGTTIAIAVPGDLDLSFGTGGIVITRGISFNHLNASSAMAIQSDGKIVVVGEGSTDGVNGWDFAVVRYNPNGSIDTSFGGTGIVITPVGSSNDSAASVAIQADGKIVVVGNGCGGVGTFCGSGSDIFAVVRYNTNGLLDTSFNSTGKVLTPVSSSDYINSVAIQADGKIVAAGGVGGSFAVFRYRTDGSLDTSLNGTGKIAAPIGGRRSIASSVGIQPDGKIVAAGTCDNPGSYDFAVVRYNPDGSFDTSFGGSGIVFTPVGNSYDVRISLAIQADGKIVAAGSGYDGFQYDFAVVRFNSNGAPDASFNGSGLVRMPVGSSDAFANSVAIQTDGKIVAAGYSYRDYGSDFAVVRLNTNGSLDTTFGGTGKLIAPLATFAQNYACAVAIQADGKIVAAGGTDDQLYDFYDFALVRYQGGLDGHIRTRFDFDGDGKADVSVFRPTDRVWYLNNSQAGFSAAQFGLSSDQITPGDFDGDGKTDIAVWRPSTGTWYIQRSSAGFTATQWGLPTDLPVPGDFDGDGKTDIAVWRPSNGVWYVIKSNDGQFTATQFGQSGDRPVAGDFDGDGKTDLAVYRPSSGTWFILQSTLGLTAVQFGVSSDKAVPADYDGDGKTDIAVYRDGTSGTWYIQQSSAGFKAVQFGTTGDIPVPADYDGDGKPDISVWRPSNGIWYEQRSTSGFAATQFGQGGDRPIPASYMSVQ